jgi:hypothetical protein
MSVEGEKGSDIFVTFVRGVVREAAYSSVSCLFARWAIALTGRNMEVQLHRYACGAARSSSLSPISPRKTSPRPQMKRIFPVGLALAVMFSASSTFAQTPPTPPAPSIDHADVFLGECQKPENLDACTMYLAGYTNGVLVQSLVDKQPARYCIPQNVNRKEQLGAITAWMKGHLNDVLQPTAAVIYKALIGAYPCK